MTRLELYQIPILAPLVEERIREASLEHRITTDRGLDNIHSVVERGTGAAFVDDPLLPTSALVVNTSPSGVLDEKCCFVLLLFVTQKGRSLRKALEITKTLEEYARAEKCDVISGSSWRYRGGDSISSLWKHAGYELQEEVWVKHLTKK